MECVSDIECIEFPSEVPCHIDLVEPVVVVNGQRVEGPLKMDWAEPGTERVTYDLALKYKVGVPAAVAFHLFFYRSAEDVRDSMVQGADPRTLQIPIPEHLMNIAFTPTLPQADPTGFWEQEGSVRIELPEQPESIKNDLIVLYQERHK